MGGQCRSSPHDPPRSGPPAAAHQSTQAARNRSGPCQAMPEPLALLKSRSERSYSVSGLPDLAQFRPFYPAAR